MKIVSLILLVSLVFFAKSSVFACNHSGTGTGGKPPEFLGKIYDVIKVEDLEGKSIGFVRWGSTIEDLNILITKGGRVALVAEQKSKEPVFNSLEVVAQNRDESTRYYIQVRLTKGISYGQAVAVYDLNLQELQKYAIARCLGSPVVFRE